MVSSLGFRGILTGCCPTAIRSALVDRSQPVKLGALPTVRFISPDNVIRTVEGRIVREFFQGSRTSLGDKERPGNRPRDAPVATAVDRGTPRLYALRRLRDRHLPLWGKGNNVTVAIDLDRFLAIS
jgi:hypothetical protein